MPSIRGDINSPAAARSGARVDIELWGDGRPIVGFVDGAQIVSRYSIATALDGSWLVAIPWGNTAITPSGSVYRIVYSVNGRSGTAFYVTVPTTGGPYDVEDILTMAPASLLPPGAVPTSGGTLTGPLTLSGNPTAALHAVPKQYLELRYRQRRTTDYRNLDLAVESAIVDQGQFTPDSATVDVDVRAALSTEGNARGNGFIYLGQPVTPGALLFDINAAALNPSIGSNGVFDISAGKTAVASIGTCAIDAPGTCLGSIRLTGVDTSKPVTWQVLGAIHGGAQFPTLGGDPTALALSPDGTKLYVVKEVGEIVPVTVGGRRFWSVTDLAAQDVLGTPIAAAGATLVAATNVYAVVTAFFGNNVFRIVAATGAVASFAMSDAGQFPWGIAITPDGATAWVGTFTGRIYPFNIAAGTWGAFVAVGGGSDIINSVWVQPDGTALWAANATTGTVRKMTLPGLVLSAPLTVGGAPQRIRGVASDRCYVAIQTTNKLKAVLTAGDGTVERDWDLPFASPLDFDLFPGGRSAFVGFAAGKMIQVCLTGVFAAASPGPIAEVTLHRTDDVSYGDISGIAIHRAVNPTTLADESTGHVWSTRKGTDMLINTPGGVLSVSPGAASFFVEFLEVSAQPAH